MEPQQKKIQPNISEEFSILTNNLIPTTLKQAEWICKQVERLTRKHPRLKEKFLENSTMSPTEKKELEKIIQCILAKADHIDQKNGKSFETTL